MEKWRGIEGHSDYIVSDQGRVFSMKSNNYIGGINRKMNHIQVAIGNKRIPIHKLVAEAFLDNPYQFKYVKHKNGDTTDNRVENLEWSQNPANRTKNQLNVEQIVKCIKMHKETGMTAYKIGKELGLSRHVVFNAIHPERTKYAAKLQKVLEEQGLI